MVDLVQPQRSDLVRALLAQSMQVNPAGAPSLGSAFAQAASKALAIRQYRSELERSEKEAEEGAQFGQQAIEALAPPVTSKTTYDPNAPLPSGDESLQGAGPLLPSGAQVTESQQAPDLNRALAFAMQGAAKGDQTSGALADILLKQRLAATMPGEAYTLSPGAQRRGPNNEVIAENPKPQGADGGGPKIMQLLNSRNQFAEGSPERQIIEQAISKEVSEKGGMRLEIGPNGEVLFTQGGGETQSLTGPTKNKLEGTIVSATERLDRLNSIAQNYDDRFLQIPGQLKAAKVWTQEKLGIGELGEEEKKFAREFFTFRRDVSNDLSKMLNELSGAAISPAEFERLAKSAPTDKDSPTEFKSKFVATVRDQRRAIMRANWALSSGISVNDGQQLEKLMPLNGIDRVYEERANAIWQQLGGDPTTKGQAIEAANKEFGVGG